MSRFFFIALFSLACFSCSKSKESGSSTNPTAEVGSSSGSAMAEGSGSAMAEGSGSAMAEGSGSAAGSGSAMAEGSAAGSGSAAAEGSAAGSGFDFDKLSHEEKMKFMKEKVVPEMKVAFQNFDKKKYKKFGCKTCHGKNAKKRKFEMPTPDLPKLDFAALKAGKQKPKVAEFMSKTVTPTMAKLLNEPVHSQSNPKGFGCLECHEQKK